MVLLQQFKWESGTTAGRPRELTPFQPSPSFRIALARFVLRDLLHPPLRITSDRPALGLPASDGLGVGQRRIETGPGLLLLQSHDRV